MKVFVAYDGSDNAEKAFECKVDLLLWCGLSLIFNCRQINGMPHPCLNTHLNVSPIISCKTILPKCSNPT